MFGDLMLRWMSETGSGDLDDLRNRVRWLARTSDLAATSSSAGRWVRDISTLGHAEIDWEGRRWSCNPGTVSRLPAAGGLAVLTGRRSSTTVADLDDGGVCAHTISCPPGAGDLPVPACVLIQFDSLPDLRNAAAAAGVQYAGCAAERLAGALAGPPPPRPAGPPTTGRTPLSRLVITDGLHFKPCEDTDADGLYETQPHGQRRYLLRRDGRWYWSDRAWGIFNELSYHRIPVMRWRPEHPAAPSGVGSAFVDWGAPLPVLPARTLIMCSGLPPKFHAAARTAEYRNVPLVTARAVAAALSQELKVTTEKKAAPR